MRALSVLLFTLLSHTSALGSEYRPSIQGECYVQAASAAELQRALPVRPRGYLTGILTDVMAGELDPFILGNGGLVSLETAQGSFLIFEASRDYPMTQHLRQNRESGLFHVALDRICVSSIRSRRQQDEMASLASRFMKKSKTPFTFLIVR